jgi:lipopolysaccharide transport system ATP-binding protein
MTTVIKAENLGKKYIIRHKQDPYDKFADVLVKPFKYVGQKLTQPFTKKPVSFISAKEEFWALKDVSFEIKQGDRVGIIGRNGAGKSTLLKLISRITEPTTGKISIKGRVSSLLEVGTGFHPELTGRENIYLNGAVLGMTRKEIKRKFDEIVAFAEVEKFLDTPVKRYSSGMYVRLAFAVAAHLEPEILIVDEVLAVGDTAFQKKCLGKMEEVGQEGRTVLFVSHNMEAIRRLCCNGIFLHNGSLVLNNYDIEYLIDSYLNYSESIKEKPIWEITDNNNFANDLFIPRRFYIGNQHSELIKMPIKNSEDVWVFIECEIKNPIHDLCIGYALFDEFDRCLYWSYQTDTSEDEWPKLDSGINILKSRLPRRLLNEGNYRLEMIGSIHYKQWFFKPRNLDNPTIFLSINGGLSDSPFWISRREGFLAPIYKWYKCG